MDNCQNCKKYHRKLQKAESLIVKLEKQLRKSNVGVNTWSSVERQLEAKQRDQMMETLNRFWEKGV
jgi:signal recognition particle GTPase